MKIEPLQSTQMKLPIGYSDFGRIIRDKMEYVDKTLFIKEILDNSHIQATIITRPRRFGKTLNLSMLRYFLSAEVDGQSTKDLFDGLKITEYPDAYMSHQGKYPVIFLTFKDIKSLTYEEAYSYFRHLISQLYDEHKYLLSSPQLTDHQRKNFLAILGKSADFGLLNNSLYDLTRYLNQHHGIKPWLLIDEYDSPIQASFFHGYYEQMISLMRGLLGSALKDNLFLERAVITGIMKVSKESLFSGLNNVMVYSLFNTKYSEHFGFTEAEVFGFLNKSQLNHLIPKIKHWYNGYQAGDTTLYNPWSIINCLDSGGELKLYWVNTSDNVLLEHLLARADSLMKIDIESLLHNESITALIDENISFKDLETSSDALWSLLVATGYLKVLHNEQKYALKQCELAVPNFEVLSLYQTLVQSWLIAPAGQGRYLAFLFSLTEGRIDEFSQYLQKYLLETMSVFDASGKEPEKFYHGFVLGLIVSLSDTHEVQSNRESGYGRYDVILIPKDPEQLGIILEFKTVTSEKEDLEQAAQQAVQQITDRQYETVLIQKGIHRILKLGLAFHGKTVAVFASGVDS
jgi:Predicted AAA-ATPase/PD-(D/E)XK nuclease superfamily